MFRLEKNDVNLDAFDERKIAEKIDQLHQQLKELHEQKSEGQSAWARDEVNLVKQRNKAKNDSFYEYLNGCYDAALDAFNYIMDQNHSGASFGITRSILNKLLDRKPLTPIDENEPEENWYFVYRGSDETGNYKAFQCKRMSSLFKTIYDDGRVTYSSTERVRSRNPDSTSFFNSSIVTKYINEKFPIKFPYSGDEYYNVVVEEFLSDERNGDFDTIGIIEIRNARNRIVKSDKAYFGEVSGKMQPITKEQYEERKRMAEALKEKKASHVIL